MNCNVSLFASSTFHSIFHLFGDEAADELLLELLGEGGPADGRCELLLPDAPTEILLILGSTFV